MNGRIEDPKLGGRRLPKNFGQLATFALALGIAEIDSTGLRDQAEVLEGIVGKFVFEEASTQIASGKLATPRAVSLADERGRSK